MRQMRSYLLLNSSTLDGPWTIVARPVCLKTRAASPSRTVRHPNRTILVLKMLLKPVCTLVNRGLHDVVRTLKQNHYCSNIDFRVVWTSVTAAVCTIGLADEDITYIRAHLYFFML
jgi:hypothetical protein